jgi:hypothetical protein
MPVPDKNGHYYFQSLCPDINKKKITGERVKSFFCINYLGYEWILLLPGAWNNTSGWLSPP